jgi:hypothetical protein
MVGAGVGRNGTNSLKVALEQLLGGTCHHMFEVLQHAEQEVPVWHAAANGTMPDWNEFLSGYTAVVDWPSASFWPEIAAAFPDAPVLLATRPTADWYKSAHDTIFNMVKPETPTGEDPWQDMVGDMLRNRFCADLANGPAMMAAYDAHNAAVRAAIPTSRLVEWTPSDGWGPICAALDVPVPDQPFPVTNTTTEIRDRFGLPPLI